MQPGVTHMLSGILVFGDVIFGDVVICLIKHIIIIITLLTQCMLMEPVC